MIGPTLLLLTGLAFGGDLYVNGTKVAPSSLANMKLEKVDITFDTSGNMHVSAPGYEIEVVDPGPAAAPTPAPAAGWGAGAAPAPAAAGSSTWADPSAYGKEANRHGEPDTKAPPGGLAKGQWWIAIEDDGSRGHTIDVLVNGHKVKTVYSGKPQRPIDVGPFMHRGTNAVQMKGTSVNADGGLLYVFIGRGTDNAGTVQMGSPDVQFGLGKSRSGSTVKDYTIHVD